MKIAIVGYATEGVVSYKYFSGRGHAVTICDANPEVTVPDGANAQLDENYLHDLDRFDVIVRSAGIHPDVILKENPNVASKITTAVNEFLRVCPTKNLIGITGTKGKGTTSTLTAKMLEAAGKNVWLGGNIGRSPLEFIDHIAPDDWVVLELSSFQLCDVRHSPHIAVCLMVVPEHLNWHADMANYVAAKSRLFAKQNSDDVAIYYADNTTSTEVASAGSAQKVPYYVTPGAWVNGNMLTIAGEELCKTEELKLLGKHNWQNACAAATAVWQALQPSTPGETNTVKSAIRDVLTTFTGLPHRLEFVRELGSIKYYNDSFASTPDASNAAVEAIPGQKIMIMGGFDRQLPLENFAKRVLKNTENIKQVLLIGTSADRVSREFDSVGFTNYTITRVKTMPEVVEAAKNLAGHGDAVILSPGFASFDMFKNFEERGNLFRDAVNDL